MDKYLELLKEANEPTPKMIPWRSGRVSIDYGETSIKGLKQRCLVLNNLKFIMKLNPSLMLIIPEIEVLQRVGGGTNGYLVTARKAQQLEYSKLESGQCKTYTYFFGRPKEGRTFDWYQRIFERGFSIENITGLDIVPDNSVIEFTARKDDYYTVSFFTGWQFPSGRPTNQDTAVKNNDSKMLIPVRIKRSK